MQPLQLLFILYNMKVILIAVGLNLLLNLIYGQAGFVDTTFGDQGLVETSLKGRETTLKIIGEKLYLSGIIRIDNLDKIGVQRFNLDGSLELTFGNQGLAIFSLSNLNIRSTDMHILNNGQILVSGYTKTLSNSFRKMLVVRFLPNGQLDTSFGSNGYSEFDFNGRESASLCMVVDEEENIYLAGLIFNNSEDALVVRLNSQGFLDQSFHFDGMVEWIDPSIDSEIQAITSKDNEIYIGICDDSFGPCALLVLNEIGGPKLNFGNSGIVDLNYMDKITKVQWSLNERLFIGGIGGNHKSIVYKLESNGSLDLSFSINGIMAHSIGYPWCVPPPIAINEDNDFVLYDSGDLILTASVVDEPGSWAFFRYGILSINSNGSINQNFGTDGLPEIIYYGGFSWDIEAVNDKFVILISSSVGNVKMVMYNSGLYVGILDDVHDSFESLVYPNPVHSEVNIQYELKETTTISFDIFDMNGSKIRTFQIPIEKSIGQHSETFNIDKLPAGNYLLKVESSEYILQAIKITKL